MKQQLFDGQSSVRTIYNIAKAHNKLGEYDSSASYLSRLADKNIDNDDMFLYYKLCNELNDINSELITWEYDKGLIPWVEKVMTDKKLSERYYNLFLVQEAEYEIALSEKKEEVSWMKIAAYVLVGLLVLGLC